uniref:SKA2 domain-containing protein n=1 Tax=Macrostomum lignano TaxID=282301 RepID=A0A1I8FAG6_9PLAT
MELIQQRLEMLERSLEEMKLSAPLKETAAGAKESYQPSIRKRRAALSSLHLAPVHQVQGEKGDRGATAEPTYDETKLKAGE